MEYWFEQVMDPDSADTPFTRRIDSKLRVGRDGSNDLVIEDGSVSRMHATVEVYNNEVWVRDLDSKNGTWIDDRAVRDAPLRPGSVLRFGRHQRFVVRTVGTVPPVDPALAARRQTLTQRRSQP